MTARKMYLRFFLGVGVIYLAVGLLWTAVNLRDIPHYGDTTTYFRYAQDLKVNEQRGIVYPFLLAQSIRLFLDGKPPGRLSQAQEKLEVGLACTAPPGLMWIQIFQLVVGAFSVFFFLWMMIGPVTRVRNGRQYRKMTEVCLLFLLIVFDPLVSHYNLALMTDGLTFSACLVFCGALIAVASRRGPPWLAGAVLCAGFVLAAGLRVEKKWILLATFLLTSLLWLWTRRRSVFPDGLNRRLTVAGVLLGCGLALVIVVQRRVYEKSDNLSSYDIFVHSRIGFPHLSELYDELPDRTRARISRKDAKQYDGHVNGIRRVVQRVAGQDERIRRELRADVLETVLPRRWKVILLDGARDAMENTLSTFSFYVRVATWRLGGEKAIQRWFYADPTVWNYQRMAFHHPSLTRIHLGLAAALLLMALPLALRELHVRRPSPVDLLTWAPCVIFCLVNAVFFAAAFNYVNFRYAIFSHAFFLVLVFRPAIRAVLDVEEAPCEGLA